MIYTPEHALDLAQVYAAEADEQLAEVGCLACADTAVDLAQALEQLAWTSALLWHYAGVRLVDSHEAIP